MQQITVNLDDSEMAALQAMAQASHSAPEDIVVSRIKAIVALFRGDAKPFEIYACKGLSTKPALPWSAPVNLVYYVLPENSSEKQQALKGYENALQWMRVAELDKSWMLTVDPLLCVHAGYKFQRMYYCVGGKVRAETTANANDPIVGAGPNASTDAALVARRAARRAALKGSQGIWEGEPGKPKDGVKYQEEMRAEWQ